MAAELGRYAELLRARAAAIAGRALEPAPDGPITEQTPEATRQLWRDIFSGTLRDVVDFLENGTLVATGDIRGSISAMNRQKICLREAIAGRAVLTREVMRELATLQEASVADILEVVRAVQCVLDVGIDAFINSAEEVFRCEQNALLDAVGGMGVVVFRADMESRLIQVNPVGVRMLGAAGIDDLTGRPFAEFYADPGEREELRRRLEKDGVASGFRFRVRRLDGSEFAAETNVRVALGPDGRPAGIEGFARDISRLVEVEKELEVERLRLRHVVSSLGAGLSLLDAELNIVWINEPMAAWFGPLEKVRGRKCFEVYQHRQDACPDCPAVQALRSNQPHVATVPTMLDGGEKMFRLTATPLRDASGRAVQVLELTQDITEERRREDELRRTSELLVGILGSAGEYGIVSTGDRGEINYFSEGAERLFGLGRADAVGKLRFGDIWAPEGRGRAAQDMKELAASGRCETEAELLRAGGLTFAARISGSARRAPDGQLTGFTFVVRDVTGERAAQKLVTLLAHALESSREGVVLADMSGVLTYVNPMLTVMTGRSAGEMLGRDFSILYPPGTVGEEIRAIARATLAGGWNGEVECARKDESRFAAQLNTSLVRDERGRALAMVGLVRDITREKSLQKRLYEQEQRHLADLEQLVRERTAELERAYRDLQKLDAMKDRFLTNISHELRTPLVSGVGYIELVLQDGLGPINDEIRKGLRVAHRNMLRLVNLIDDLLAFTRLEAGRESMVISQFSLDQMVTDCLLDLKVRAGKSELRVDMDVEKGLPPVEADEENIHRVFANLLSNAEKFTGDRAHITVTARRAAENRVEVRIADDGIGIPQDELNLVFERFYRSRQTVSTRYGGTGIGLSLVKEIIGSHGGVVRAEVAPGGGTVVIFTLPLATHGQPATPEAPRQGGGVSTGRRSAVIMVVDDDSEVHDLLRTVFGTTGDAVFSATDGMQAIEMLEQGIEADLVFLDIAMPNMSGLEVLQRLRASERCRDLPVYMLTARADDLAAIESRKFGASGFLTKPFAISEVREVVNEVLAGAIPPPSEQ